MPIGTIKWWGAFLAHVFLPTALGAAVYLGWRSTDLLVFRWLEAAGLDGFVARPSARLPNVVLYSLPDGCWVYATTGWMFLVWGRVVWWTFAGLALALGGEAGQWIGVVPGTFDWADVAFYVGGFISSWGLIRCGKMRGRRSGF